MKIPPSIQTKRLILRPFSVDDSQDIQRIAGHPLVAATTRYIPHPYPDGFAQAWIATLIPNYNRGIELSCAIELADTHQLLGSVGLSFDKENQSASLGFWLDPDCWGNGYAPEAAKGLVSYGFNVLGLNRIQAYCLSANTSSEKVLLKVGMQKEGMARQVRCIRGKLSDLSYFGMLKSDFEKFKLK